ncbi:MAG: electron transfer flavoprotein subunit alpha/FixB family protein [Acidobacteria bacterium]|nr:electron transfer flavoprotein subunit alpha/FixB family protein [Acidobacteriota bacterium]
MSGVLVVMEQAGGAWHKMSWETLVAGQQAARAMGQPLVAAVVGSGVSPLAAELACRVAARVVAVDEPRLESYSADGFADAVAALVRHTGAALVLFPHTYQVRDFAPKVATRFNQVLVSDVVRLDVEDGAVRFTRQLFQGKMNAGFRPAGGGPVFASVQAGSYRPDELQAGSGTVETFTPELGVIRARHEAPFRESSRAVDLTAAEIIVSVGRGIKEKENIAVVEELARALGGELAASRPICDNGWLPMERQVGSSGQTVSPKVYIAVGISGAIQHLVGMKGSKAIVAINKDSNAPIFEVADYGIVGDLFEVVPALVEEVRKAKG